MKHPPKSQKKKNDKKNQFLVYCREVWGNCVVLRKLTKEEKREKREKREGGNKLFNGPQSVDFG